MTFRKRAPEYLLVKAFRLHKRVTILHVPLPSQNRHKQVSESEHMKKI
jgi:hypothetical protein